MAVVRVTGPRTFSVLRCVCPAAPAVLPPRVQLLLAIRRPDDGRLLDRGLVTAFPAPASYSGEDTVEFSTHGGSLTPQLVLDALLAAGARLAEPGEFTRRAYLNGKLDLLQAEAVLDLIDAGSPALHRNAVYQMERGLSASIEELRAELIGVEALLAYGIDFPEEDEPPVPPERIAAATANVLRRIDHLLENAPRGEMLRDGALAVFAGLPNSGKSSLFNALLGVERAIVTPIAGTTRDAIEAETILGDFPFRLVDTAGLRDTTDQVEELGIEVARRYLRAAHIVIFCAEAGRALLPQEQQFLRAGPTQIPLILCRTKTDLNSFRATTPAARGDFPARETRSERNTLEIPISARAGSGLGALRDALVRHAFGGLAKDAGVTPLITSARQARSLAAARDELHAFQESMASGVPPEISAVLLRSAVAALEELVGAVTPDDVLAKVFGAFCVGK